MPPTTSFYRISYLQKNQDNLTAAQLLEWLAVAKETIEINEQTINQLITEQEVLINQLSELQKEVNKKANKNEAINQEEAGKIYKLIGELEQKEQQNQDLHRQNATLEKELTKLKKKLAQENQQKEQIINVLQNTVQQQSETINDFQQRIQSLNGKQKKVRQSKQRLEKELAEVFSGEAQKEIKIQKLKASLIFHKDKLIGLSKIQEELTRENQTFENNNYQLQNDLEVISEKLTASHERNLLLEEKIEELKEQLQENDETTAGERITQLEWEVDNQKGEYEELEDKYQTLYQDSQKLKAELAREQAAKKNGWGWGKTILISGAVGIIILGIVFWKKLKSLFL